MRIEDIQVGDHYWIDRVDVPYVHGREIIVTSIGTDPEYPIEAVFKEPTSSYEGGLELKPTSVSQFPLTTVASTAPPENTIYALHYSDEERTSPAVLAVSEDLDELKLYAIADYQDNMVQFGWIDAGKPIPDPDYGWMPVHGHEALHMSNDEPEMWYQIYPVKVIKRR